MDLFSSFSSIYSVSGDQSSKRPPGNSFSLRGPTCTTAEQTERKEGGRAGGPSRSSRPTASLLRSGRGRDQSIRHGLGSRIGVERWLRVIHKQTTRRPGASAPRESRAAGSDTTLGCRFKARLTWDCGLAGPFFLRSFLPELFIVEWSEGRNEGREEGRKEGLFRAIGE